MQAKNANLKNETLKNEIKSWSVFNFKFCWENITINMIANINKYIRMFRIIMINTLCKFFCTNASINEMFESKSVSKLKTNEC